MLNNELEVLNLILRKLGEPPISSVDTQYPTLDLIRPALEESRSELLYEGWWFNTVEGFRVLPDPGGVVRLPPDTLVFYPDDPRWVWVGDTVETSDGSPVVGEAVTGRRVLNRDFYSIPASARWVIVYSAAAQVYAADIGVDDIYNSILALRAAAYMELSAQHTRQRKLTTRNKPHVQRWRNHLRS